MNMPNIVEENIIQTCQQYNVHQVVLFGSRARGSHTDRSDIDLAIAGCEQFDALFAELKYNEFTLLDIDVINLDEDIDEKLRKEIATDGIVLYEKDGKNV